MSQQIIDIIVSVFPSVLSILTTVAVVAKVVRDFVALKKQVTDMKCIDELKSQMRVVLEENYALKKTLNETMTKIDGVRRDK